MTPRFAALRLSCCSLPGGKLDRLVCNAAVYLPTDPKPRFTDDGHEMSLQVNHLGHFLLLQLLMPQLQKAKEPRVCVVGSVTGNKNTVAGSLVKPNADVGDLSGLQAPPAPSNVMVDGAKKFDGAKVIEVFGVIEALGVIGRLRDGAIGALGAVSAMKRCHALDTFAPWSKRTLAHASSSSAC